MVFHPILCYLSPKILIFQELLIIETWNLCHWIWHASNPKHVPLKPFWCMFPSQNQQNVKSLAVCLTPPDKNEKNYLYREKVFRKAQKSAHMGFWVCWSQWTMLDLCVTSTFWVVMVFSWFVTGRCRYKVLKHGVGIQWDPRSTAA